MAILNILYQSMLQRTRIFLMLHGIKEKMKDNETAVTVMFFPRALWKGQCKPQEISIWALLILTRSQNSYGKFCVEIFF